LIISEFPGLFTAKDLHLAKAIDQRILFWLEKEAMIKVLKRRKELFIASRYAMAEGKDFSRMMARIDYALKYTLGDES